MSFKLRDLKFVRTRSDIAQIPPGKVLINTINAHTYNIAQTDKLLADSLSKCDYLLADGVSIVVACKLLRRKNNPEQRCPGWDLFEIEMEKLNQTGGKVMFVGSTEKVLSLIREKAKTVYPNLEVVTYSPPFKPELSPEDSALTVEAINAANPDLLWVGMTAPKQEKWLYSHWHELNIHCHAGSIGAVFDFFAGTAPRAPWSWQKHGFEWLFRLLHNPRRMWRRYLVGNPLFVWNIIKEYSSRNRYVRNIEDLDGTEKPKILFVLHLPPPVHGAAMVGKWIHDSKAINESFNCRYVNLTAAASLADIGKVGFQKLVQFLKLLSHIRHVVKQFNPDLVYITPNASGGAFYKDFVVVTLLKLLGCRILCHYHNKGVRRRQSYAIDDFLYRQYFQGIKVLLIVPQLYDDMKKYLHIRDTYFCPNGVPRVLTSGNEIEADRHNEIPEILYLSNLFVSKGILDLLDALYLLRGEGYNFHCTIVGAEAFAMNGDRLEEEIRSRYLQDMVTYVGPKYGDEKNIYLDRADMMVFPTYYAKECFPLVNLEAMERKLPIISTQEGGIPYMIKDGKTGLICKSRNPIDLSHSIAKLIDNPDLRVSMGEEGYKFFLSEFTIDSFIDRMINVFNRVLKETPEQRKYLINL